MASAEAPPQPTVSDEVDEIEDDEGDWTDATSSEEEDDDDDEDSSAFPADMDTDIRTVIELAEQNNALLHGLMAHPKLNRSNPAASPKPLFFVADFVRRTYLEYTLPLLPKDAPYRSARIANRFVIGYAPQFPDKPECPEPPADGKPDDTWLHDLSNWPSEEERGSKEHADKMFDLLTRTQTAAMFIKDPKMMEMTTGEKFDWTGGPVPLLEIAQNITRKS